VPVLRCSLVSLALGPATGLPSACADTPKVERFEMSEQERTRFRETIRGLRELLRQEEAAIARGSFDGASEEVRQARRLLRQMEWAYENNLPSPVKLSPVPKRP
jgi:hypothetical protein